MHLPGESTPLAAKRFAGLRSRRTFPSPSPSSHAGVSGLVPECSLPLDNQDSLASALLGLRLLLLRGFIVESLGFQALFVQGLCWPQLLEHDGVTQGDRAARRDNLDPI